MFKALTRFITILCTLSLPIVQLPTTYAGESLIEKIQRVEKVSEKKQVKLLSKLKLPVKQYLSNEILKQSKKRTSKELREHGDYVNSVSFSPDGTKVASGSDDHTIKIWDVQTGKVLQTLKGHQDWVNSVPFSPNGTKLASGSGDQTIRICNLYDQQDLQLLNEIKRLGSAQALFLYVLYWNQEGLKSNEGVDLTKTEKALKEEYGKKCQEPPLLLNLKDSYNRLSPELQALVKVAFHIID